MCFESFIVNKAIDKPIVLSGNVTNLISLNYGHPLPLFNKCNKWTEF